MTGFILVFIAAMWLTAYPVVSFFTNAIAPNWSKGRRRLCKLGLSLLLGWACSAVRLLALVMLHLAVLIGLSKAVHGCLRLAWKGYSNSWLLKLYKTGLVPLGLTALLLIYGFWNINHVRQTVYTLSSDKLQQDWQIVFISDLHYGTVQSVDVLEDKIQEINALEPDLVILGGDLLDESTTGEEMRGCFAALGKLESRYGCYYVYGNHDRQRYSQAPAYSERELRQAMEENGITILQEAAMPIGSDLLLLGREDRGTGRDRKNTEALLKGIDPGRFLLVADHQPFDAEENEALGADLQLSGHTHGGQIFPLGLFEFFFQGYPYGRYRVEDMTLLVCSGFAGWGFPVRTQGVSEYLVVRLISQESGEKNQKKTGHFAGYPVY